MIFWTFPVVPWEWVNEYFIYPRILEQLYRSLYLRAFPNPNHQYNNKGQTTNTGTSFPTFYDKHVDSFTFPANHNMEDAGVGANGL